MAESDQILGRRLVVAAKETHAHMFLCGFQRKIVQNLPRRRRVRLLALLLQHCKQWKRMEQRPRQHVLLVKVGIWWSIRRQRLVNHDVASIDQYLATHLMFSNELLLDVGDLEDFGWSSLSSADTENASDFFDWNWTTLIHCSYRDHHLLTWGMSVIGEFVILGGGGESTSNSRDEDRDRECDLDRLRLRDRDLVLVTLIVDGETHTSSDLAWYVLLLSSSSDSCFSINRFTPNLISSARMTNAKK